MSRGTTQKEPLNWHKNRSSKVLGQTDDKTGERSRIQRGNLEPGVKDRHFIVRKSYRDLLEQGRVQAGFRNRSQLDLKGGMYAHSRTYCGRS